MEFQDFKRKLVRTIKQMNPEAEVSLSPVFRNNGGEDTVLLIMQKGENCSPGLCLSLLYEHYCRNELTVRQSAEYAMDLYRDMMSSLDRECQMEKNILDFNKIRKNLTIKMVNRERNQKQLENVVSIPFLDLSGILYVADSLESMNSGIKVTRELMTIWNVRFEEILETALFNLECHGGFEMRPINEVLSEISGCHASCHEEQSPGLFVVSDISHRNGPSVLLLPNVLKRMAGELGDDLLILPSSIHEMILLRATGPDSRELKRIVTEINHSVVSREEFLGNHVYKYSRGQSNVEIEI